MAVATVALVVLVLPAALLLRSVVAVLVAVLVALALGAAAVRLVGRGSASVALAATGARPVGADDEPRLHNLVDGLRVAMGVPEPSLWVVEDPSPNVLAVARNADESALVVTRGLLDGLTRVELEAVLAHQLARIRSGEVAAGSAALLALGGTRVASVPEPSPAGPPASTGRALGPGLQPSARPARLAWPLLLVAPLTRALVVRLVEPGADSEADVAAVQVTRFPPALAAALEKVAAAPEPPAVSDLVAHLWLVPPDSANDPAVQRVFDPPPPVADRIDTLLEL